MQTISHWWMWASFITFVLIMLSIDLFLLGGKKSHRVSTKEALSWVIAWTVLALTFNFLLWLYLNHTVGSVIANEKSLEFLTGYLIEESLSVDNMFIFLMIFTYFAVPIEYQRRVLFFGVFGAIVMRLLVILLGVWVVGKIHWILYIFGVFLIYTGIKMFIFAEKKYDLKNSSMIKWMKKHLRVTDQFHGERFFVHKNKWLYITPLFMVLVLIEFSDLIFALDSLPAIFAITQDPFIIFSSNVFAIVGLRSLYFLVANMSERFHLLKYGVALILIFVGLKMLLSYWFKIPILIALGVIIYILLISVIFSIKKQK